MNLMKKPCLVLNGSYEPIRIIPIRRAMVMISKGTATIEVSTNIQVHKYFCAPSVIRLMHYRRVPSRLQIVSRRNIIIRDSGMCMYCGKKTLNLTLDHIIPRSKGGSNSWDNLVACCPEDNRRKGDKTLEEAGMKLIHKPLPQSIHTARFLLRSMGLELDKEWSKYLWTTPESEKRLQFVN
jgi:5-methylcytosine-specific restriction endonuclease McrA